MGQRTKYTDPLFIRYLLHFVHVATRVDSHKCGINVVERRVDAQADTARPDKTHVGV